MRQIPFAVLALLLSSQSFADVLTTVDFETAGVGYSTSVPEFSDGAGDFFTQTDGSSNIGSFYNVTGFEGAGFFAGMDLDGEGATLPLTLSISGINIAGFDNLAFSSLLAEDDDGSTNQDWDSSDFVRFEYSIDGGAFQSIFEVAGQNFTSTTAGGTNGEPFVGNTALSSAFAQFDGAIAGTGNNLDLQIVWNLNSGDEDLAIDFIQVSGDSMATIPEPSSFAALACLGAAGVVSRRRRRA